MSFFVEQAKNQFTNLPVSLTVDDCKGKTYIVTGSNIGLGFECAKHLVQLESQRVILAVRSVDRGQEAAARIEAETARKGVVEVWQLDLSSYESVKEFASRVERDLDRVDAVVQNAAAANGAWIALEGLESSLTVNVVSTLLLTVLLMPHLEACAKRFGIQPHISIVTSGLAFGREGDLAKIKGNKVLDDLNDSKKWSMEGTGRYGLSKLIQVLATRRLASLAPASRTGVVINYIDPGLCNTGLSRYSGTSTKMLVGVLRLAMGRSAEWGSRTLLFGIAAQDSHGKYLAYCQDKDKAWLPAWVTNESGQEWSRRIWDELAADFEGIAPGSVKKALGGYV